MFRHRYILHSHSPQMSVRLALGLSLAALAASVVLASPLVLVSSLQTRHSLVSSAVTSYCIEVGKGGTDISRKAYSTRNVRKEKMSLLRIIYHELYSLKTIMLIIKRIRELFEKL